jgi:3-methyladenine DNA glycosylase AlkD
MDRFVHNDEFNKDVIHEKLADISSKLEEEQEKSNEERDVTRERDLVYAQMIQGLKLNTLQSNRKLYF